VEYDKIELKTRNAFLLACEKRGIEAVVLVALASEMQNNDEAEGAHKAALDAVLSLYEL